MLSSKHSGEAEFVIIECTNCHARYQYNEDRFERKPSKKIKCAKCSTIFEIHNPAFASKPVVAAVSSDLTFVRPGGKPAPARQESTEQSPLPKRDEPFAAGGAASAELQLPAGKRLSLAIINGNDVGTVHRIEKPLITIGRAGSDVNINDTEASRQHAQIEVRDAVFRLVDLGSTNGTLIDGERINGAVEITNQSEFQIGGTTLMLIV